MTSLILTLPRYVLKAFLAEWLEIDSIILLDTAVVNREGRDLFLVSSEALLHRIVVPQQRSLQCYLWMVKKRRYISALDVLWESWLIKQKFELNFPIFSRLERVSIRSENGYDLFLPLCNSPILTKVCLVHLREDCLDQWVHCSLPTSLKSLELQHILSCLSPAAIQRLFTNVKELETLKIYESSNYKLKSKLIYSLNTLGLHLKVLSLSGWIEGSVQYCIDTIEENCPLLEDLSLSLRCDVILLTPLTSLLWLRRLSVTQCLFLSLSASSSSNSSGTATTSSSDCKGCAVFHAVEDLTVTYSHLSDGCLSSFPHLTHLTLVNAASPLTEGCRYIVSTASDVSAQLIVDNLHRYCPFVGRVDLKELAMPEWEQRRLRQFNSYATSSRRCCESSSSRSSGSDIHDCSSGTTGSGGACASPSTVAASSACFSPENNSSSGSSNISNSNTGAVHGSGSGGGVGASCGLFVNIGRCKQPSSLHHLSHSASTAAANRMLQQQALKGDSQGNWTCSRGLVYRFRVNENNHYD